jgi:hypothetical protein
MAAGKALPAIGPELARRIVAGRPYANPEDGLESPGWPRPIPLLGGADPLAGAFSTPLSGIELSPAPGGRGLGLFYGQRPAGDGLGDS